MSHTPCVIYMHGNASSQLEGQFLVPNFCPHGICLFCFDFVGCGCSDGQYISLGYYEKEDTEAVIRFLHTTYHLGPFVLWGRSMGAAAALLVDLPNLVVGKVADSAFTSIPAEIAAIAAMVKVPGVFVPAATWFLKKKVIKLADFDLSTVSPLRAVRRIACPTVFGHAEGDQFVPFAHLGELFGACVCSEKYMMVLKGGHNSRRDVAWLRMAVEFALEKLGRKIAGREIVIVAEARRLQESTAHFDSFKSLIANTRAVGDVEEDLQDPVLKEIAEVENEVVEGEGEGGEAEGEVVEEVGGSGKSIGTQTRDIFGLPGLEVALRGEMPPE